MEMPKHVVLVGHCSPDSSYLTLAIRSVCPDAQVQRVNDDAALRGALEAGCELLLINRMLDGDFAECSGVATIAACHQFKPQIPAMLVSNFADAQAQALAAGAMPGFGKHDLGHSKARDALVAVLGKGL